MSKHSDESLFSANGEFRKTVTVTETPPDKRVTTWCRHSRNVQVVILKFKLQYSTINLYKVTLTKIKAYRKQNWHSLNSKVFTKYGKQCLHQVVKGLMSSRMAVHVR